MYEHGDTMVEQKDLVIVGVAKPKGRPCKDIRDKIHRDTFALSYDIMIKIRDIMVKENVCKSKIMRIAFNYWYEKEYKNLGIVKNNDNILQKEVNDNKKDIKSNGITIKEECKDEVRT